MVWDEDECRSTEDDGGRQGMYVSRGRTWWLHTLSPPGKSRVGLNSARGIDQRCL